MEHIHSPSVPLIDEIESSVISVDRRRKAWFGCIVIMTFFILANLMIYFTPK